MRLTTVILIATLMQVSAAGFAQKISMSKSNASLKAVLREIKSQSGYNFVYRDKVLVGAKPVNINVKQVEVEEVLKQIFKDQNLSYSIDSKTVIVKTKTPSFLDNIIAHFSAIDVRGKIIGENDEVLVGATVKVKGTNRVTKSNEKGEFYLAGVQDDAVLEISYIGFKALEIPVKGAVMPLEIKLNMATGELEEVKVVYNTGYQTLSKERATGSVTVIDNKKFNEQVGTNVLSRLPAIASGLTLIPSIANSANPLVMRGVQTINGPLGPLIVVDDFPYDGDINNINPNDIENITLLKDASAASIWGAKAGNGVIVITTKRGKLNQKVSGTVSSNLTITNKPDLFYLPRANSSDLIEFESFLFSNGYYDADLTNSPRLYQSPVIDILEKERKNLISSIEANGQLDVLRKNDLRNDITRYVYRSGVNQQYSLNLSGGSNNLGWLLSAGVDRSKNYLDAGYNRSTFRFNNTYKPLKQLSVSTGVDVVYSESMSGKQDISGETDIPLYTRLKNEQGTELSVNSKYRQGFIDTAGHGKLLDWRYFPLQDYKHSANTTSMKSIVGNIGVAYSILPGLVIDMKYKLQIQQQKGRLFNDETSFYTRDYINRFSSINNLSQVVTRPVPLGGIMDINDKEINSHNLRGQLSWNKVFGEHNIRTIIGSEITSVVTDNLANRYYGYNDGLKAVATVDYLRTYPHYISNLGSSFIENNFRMYQLNRKLVSQYMNGEYAYKGKYMLSASARKDGANLFGVETNNKWNLLWSTGAAWDISKEEFYKSTFLPYLKFRATYGFGGNVLPNASSKTTLTYPGISEYTGGQRASVSSFLNPDLRWEKIRTINIGIDFSFKSDRLTGSIDYFRKKGTDLYDSQIVDKTLGLGRAVIQNNNGEMLGKGLEVSLNSVNINSKIRWTSDLIFNYYQDKILKFYTPSLAAYNFIGGSTLAQGYSRFSLFAYRWAGLNHNTGDPQGYLHGKPSTDYYALYGDSATVDDLSYKGSLFPKWYGSLGNSVTFKNFTLTARLTYAFDYYFQRTSFDYSTSAFSQILHADYSNRWKQPGDEAFTNVPSLVYDQEGMRAYFYQSAEILSTRADHIRLQYVNLSYVISRSILPKLPFSNLRLSLIGNDLGVLWKANKNGIDPNSVNSIPTPKSYVFSINANF